MGYSAYSQEEKRISKLKQEIAVDLRKKGEKPKTIALILGVTPAAVTKWLRKRGYRSNMHFYDIETIDKVASLYGTMTRREIAEKMGLSVNNIMYILKAYGITKNEEL